VLLFVAVSGDSESQPPVGTESPALPESAGVYTPGYFETRLSPDANRAKVWRHVCEYLRRWVRGTDAVLELGAGWCDFANHIRCASVVAMDMDATVRRAAAPHVTAVVGDSTDLSVFHEGSFDVVFASNLLEHLERPACQSLLRGVRRVLRPGGRLILMQPNFRLNPGRYFDDYTHVAIFTDQSLADFLVSEGWEIETVMPRFLPLTLKSRGSGLTFLVPWYLRSPVKPLAGQMLVVANPVEGMSHVER
jgi:ubiquinone/menaquinone biosynthesis C-methylase UbiE